MKIKKSKKLVVASAALLVALATSTTSTFAWFTSNSNVAVDGITGQVVTESKDLLVAWAGAGSTATTPAASDYHYYIDLSTYFTASNGAFKDLKFDDITSTTDTVGTKFAKDNGYDSQTTSGSDKNYTGDVVAVANKDYVEFRLSFLSTTACSVYLDTTVTDPAGTGANQASSVTATPNNAVKVPTWAALGDSTKTGTVINSSSSDDIKALVKDGNLVTTAANATRISFTNNTITRIWEPNATKGFELLNGGSTTYNVSGGYWDYLNATTGTDTTSDGNFGNCLTSTDHSYAASNKAGLDKYTTVLKDTAITASSYALCTLNANEAQTVTIRIWIEGNDTDCLNTCLADTLAVVLGFTTVV